ADSHPKPLWSTPETRCKDPPMFLRGTNSGGLAAFFIATGLLTGCGSSGDDDADDGTGGGSNAGGSGGDGGLTSSGGTTSAVGGGGSGGTTPGDRKSTRLNSSHVKISYAVFC